MKTAIELYASTLDEDAVLSVLDAVKETVQSISESLKKEIEGVTYH